MNPEFGTTLVQHLNQSCVFVVLQSNIIKIKFDKAELGLRDVPLPRGGVLDISLGGEVRPGPSYPEPV